MIVFRKNVCISLCGLSFVYFSCFIRFVIGYSFNVQNVSVLESDSRENSYFGYSVLLQKGEPSFAIVGAPKETSEGYGGSVFRCLLNGANRCEIIFHESDASFSPNGNFFGGTLDGENVAGGNFSACAHLSSIRSLSQGGFDYPKGRCFFFTPIENEMNVLSPFEYSEETASVSPSWYEFGLAMTGFDQTYIQDQRTILLGLPGTKSFDGITASCPLNSQIPCKQMPRKGVPDFDEAYLGYKVATGKFEKTRQQISYIAGAPRANLLKGKVIIYKSDVRSRHQIKILNTFEGDEVGSYFGSTVLAVDVTNDGIDDVLIGAPMSAGATYDEGHVNFYQILEGDLYSDPVKLTGSRQAGGRFGSSMVSLGDFDLDSFNDVAIAAPYENDGIGAVYIYRGNEKGLVYSQKISPSDFTITVGSNTNGFGLGMSRGVDIDRNGHNDLAIGAYKSDKVFVVTGKTIVDYELSLSPNINAIGTETTFFDVEFCFGYKQRSPVNDVKELHVALTLELDYRTDDGAVKVFEQTATRNERFCDTYEVKIRDTSGDISNYEIALVAKIHNTNLIANGRKYTEISIPFAHGCGADNVCNTRLSLILNSVNSKIILGLDKEFQLDVEVTNEGEPAYQCKLKMEIPSNVFLLNMEECEKDSDNILICFVDKRLLGSKKKQYYFDVSSLDPGTTEVEIRVEVISLGHNDLNFKDLDITSVPIFLQNSPYIVGKSEPDTIDLEINKDKSIEVLHKFTIGNLGPSPAKLDVSILLPILGDEQFAHVRGFLRGEEIICFPDNSSILDIPEVSNFEDSLNVPVNKTIQVSCLNEKCAKYSCQGGYLVKSNEVAVFEAKTNMDVNLIASIFKEKEDGKALYMIYVPMALVKNSTDIISTTSRLTIILERQQGIPLYIVIISILAGFALLIIVVYGLYLFHFFDRVYKDKLNQEKILDSGNGKQLDADYEGTSNEAMENDVELSEMKATIS